jgi:UDP-N-acetylglucosamine 4,6-dehydratase
VLVSEDEARNAVEAEEMFVIQPSHPWWGKQNWVGCRPLPEGFRYSSDTNTQWLSTSQLEEIVNPDMAMPATISESQPAQSAVV